ncbi:HlyD family type I secretion periplasmic adaptor subunit [uncultured Roseobacter sp.]|uniref:HlyD family type I secretion periplasmic adaptor subunit n=1 Tax=uncultured Roseobacter sp. TaxID=114847 RepID=UPI00261DA8F5|nr:HlyD family type I secretion periplasmic adaptor subunit [uncultured Roseobacter sp.]
MMEKEQNWSVRIPLVIGFTTTFLLLSASLLWGMHSNISGAVIAWGTIQVESNRQVIQHPQGGVVKKLYVKDGVTVNPGDTLLEFDDTQVRSEVAIFKSQLYEILARKVRLETERDGGSRFSISDELEALIHQEPTVQLLVNGQARLFSARAVSLKRRSEQIDEKISQTLNQISGAKAQLASLRTQEELIREELRDATVLFEKGLSPASRVSSLKRELARLTGELGNTTSLIAQYYGEIANFRIEKISLSSSMREEAISALRDLQVHEAELKQRLLNSTFTLSNMVVRAPVSGIIYGSKIHALQSVVSPAEPILYIVPQDQPLIASTKVEPLHIDQVYVGQTATVRLPSLDLKTSPEIEGIVTRISADVFSDETSGTSYYQVEVELPKKELIKLGAQELLPGMPVEAFIKTNERSPISYLMKPLSMYFSRALRSE